MLDLIILFLEYLKLDFDIDETLILIGRLELIRRL
jgi:hypothetical protein